jgi:hypothetical protein
MSDVHLEAHLETHPKPELRDYTLRLHHDMSITTSGQSTMIDQIATSISCKKPYASAHYHTCNSHNIPVILMQKGEYLDRLRKNIRVSCINLRLFR